MMTEKKATTAEDVERWAEYVQINLGVGKAHPVTKSAVLDPLFRIRAAALLGVQVPGLRADLAQRTRERDSEMEERWKVSEVKRQQADRAEAAEQQLSALQARVAELTRERDAHRLNQADLVTERDALRTQVAKAQALVTAAIRAGGSEEGERLANDIRAALSTPPAEEKKPQVATPFTPEEVAALRGFGIGSDE